MQCRVCTNPDIRVIDRIKTPNCQEAVAVCYCAECRHYSLFPTQYQQQKTFEWDGVSYYLRDADRRKWVTGQVMDRLYTAYCKANNRSPGSFLDVGCAIGLSLPIAQARGMQAVGIEPEVRLAEYGRTAFSVDIRHGMLGEIDLGSDLFDLIYCDQVLEHVDQPGRFLRGLKRLMAPGGHLYIGVPPVFPLNRLTTYLIRKTGISLPGTVLTNIFHDPDEHISAFSLNSMRRLATDCGLHLKIPPLELADFQIRRILKYFLTLGSSPGAFLLTGQTKDGVR